MKYFLFIVLLGVAVIIAGCASETQKSPASQIPSPVITPSDIPTTTEKQTVKITTVMATKTPPAPTAVPKTVPSKPMVSPVVVNGTSGSILRFQTVAPGVVKFTIHYGGGEKINNNGDKCTDFPLASLRLAGSSIDASLYSGVATSEYTGTTTFNLVSPGHYSLTTRGCYSWKVDIDNA
jgi:hypothetical protein